MSLKRETRQQWGARDPSARRYDVGWSGVSIHYPGASTRYRDQTHAQHRENMRTWQAQHMNRGSNDLEYGSVICPCGVWMEARTEWDRAGVRVGSNGTADANYHYTSVQLMLGVDEGITDQEAAWAGEAVAWLRSKGWGNVLLGHRETYPTACPGDSIQAALPDIEAYAAGAAPPTPPADPEEDEDTMLIIRAGSTYALVSGGRATQVQESSAQNMLSRLPQETIAGVTSSDMERLLSPAPVSWIPDGLPLAAGALLAGVAAGAVLRRS